MEDGHQPVSPSQQQQSFQTAIHLYNRMLLVLKLFGVYVKDSTESSPRSKRSDILQKCYSSVLCICYWCVPLFVCYRQLGIAENKLGVMGGLMVSVLTISVPTVITGLSWKGSAFSKFIEQWKFLRETKSFHEYPLIAKYIKLYIALMVAATVFYFCTFAAATWVFQAEDILFIVSPFQFSNMTAGDESVTMEIGLSMLYMCMATFSSLTVWTTFFITAYIIKTEFDSAYQVLSKVLKSVALQDTDMNRGYNTQNGQKECHGQDQSDIKGTGNDVNTTETKTSTTGNAVGDIEDARLYHDGVCGLLDNADAVFSLLLGDRPCFRLVHDMSGSVSGGLWNHYW